MEICEESKLPREFYEGVLSIRNELADFEVPIDIIDDVLDVVEGEILGALVHAGEEPEEGVESD